MALKNHTQPFFSIVVPTYNRATYLSNALHSLLAQSFKDFEIIVVDDGSTDNTYKVISSLSAKNSSLKYFYKQNEERSIARNFGIQKAAGKYVGFLDSDDRVYPNHLETAHRMLAQNLFPAIGHLGYEIIDENGEVILRRDNLGENVKEILIHENILHGNSIFIKREVAESFNFIPSRYAIVSEDWYLWLRLAARYKIYIDNTVTSAIWHHRERSLLNIKPESLIASTKLLIEYLSKDEIFCTSYRGKIGYHFANHYTFLTLILALSKTRKWKTIQFLFKAIGCDFTVIFRRRFLASVKYLVVR